MAAHVGPHSRSNRSLRAGTLTLVLGILFSAAVALTYVLSLSDGFNPPNWVRAIGLVWLPIGFGGTPIAYAVARHGQGRDQARLGVLIALGGLVALVALVVAIG